MNMFFPPGKVKNDPKDNLEIIRAALPTTGLEEGGKAVASTVSKGNQLCGGHCLGRRATPWQTQGLNTDAPANLEARASRQRGSFEPLNLNGICLLFSWALKHCKYVHVNHL